MATNTLGRCAVAGAAIVGGLCLSYAAASVPDGYKGKPFADQFHHPGPQVIPGKMQSALFDLGGEGVAYHMLSHVNEGAKLNHISFMHKSPDGTSALYNHSRPGVPAYIVTSARKVSRSLTRRISLATARAIWLPPQESDLPGMGAVRRVDKVHRESEKERYL